MNKIYVCWYNICFREDLEVLKIICNFWFLTTLGSNNNDIENGQTRRGKTGSFGSGVVVLIINMVIVNLVLFNQSIYM